MVKFKTHLGQEGWREALLLGIGYLVAAPLNNYADALLVIESMKLQMTIAAACTGTVEQLPLGVGQTFQRGVVLAQVKPDEEVE